MRALRVCVALTLAVARQAAGAEVLGVVAVAPPPGPGPELVGMTQQLAHALAAHHPGVLDARQVRERMVGQVAGASLAELERATEAARAAWVNGDYEGSARTLRAIVEDLEKLPESREAFGQWTKAMLRLARIELHLGRAKEAQAVIERLVRAAPDVEVDPALHPARLVQQIESARRSARSAPRRSLRITASAEGVRVYVDGREAGIAPVTVDLAPGRHRVGAAHGELRIRPAVVELDARDEELFLDCAAAEALRPALGPGLALAPEDRGRWIVAAGGHLGLDALLAVSLAEEAGSTLVVGSLYDVRRGMLRREARVRLAGGSVPAGGASALAEFLVTGLATSALVEIPGERRLAAQPAAAGPAREGAVDLRLREPPVPARRSRAAGWIGLGTGIAALGLATVAAVETQSASSRYDQARELRARGDLSTSDVLRYNGYVTEGDAAARKAAFLWVGAGVSALTTGILGYVQYRRTGEVGPFRF